MKTRILFSTKVIQPLPLMVKLLMPRRRRRQSEFGACGEAGGSVKQEQGISAIHWAAPGHIPAFLFPISCSSLSAQHQERGSHWAPPSRSRQSFPWLSSNPQIPTAQRVSNRAIPASQATQKPPKCAKTCSLAYFCPP